MRWWRGQGKERTMRTIVSLGVVPPARHLLAIMAVLVSPCLSGMAAAQTVTTTHQAVNWQAVNPCTGELVTGSGFVHGTFTLETTPNLHISGEFNAENFKGTTGSGVQYIATEQDNFHFIFDVPDFAPATYTVELTTHLVRQGQDPSFTNDDFHVRIKGHVTVNANGAVTAQFSDFTTECK